MDPTQVTLAPGTLFALLILVTAGVAIGRLMTNVPVRVCPRCGRRVKKGPLQCKHCDFDFNTISNPMGGTHD